MLSFNRRTRVFVCKEPADMRASYDTLFNRVKQVLVQDPMSGHLFVFINSKRTTCKCLYYDGTGLVIVSKRLESGQFSRVNPMYEKELSLTAAEFSLFFEGANLEKRFIESPAEIKKFLKSKKTSCTEPYHVDLPRLALKRVS
jgi:transposase